MIDNTRRAAIIGTVQAWLDEVLLRPPGKDRARKAAELGRTIAALNSAQTDSDVGAALLEMYGAKQ